MNNLELYSQILRINKFLSTYIKTFHYAEDGTLVEYVDINNIVFYNCTNVMINLRNTTISQSHSYYHIGKILNNSEIYMINHFGGYEVFNKFAENIIEKEKFYIKDELLQLQVAFPNNISDNNIDFMLKNVKCESFYILLILILNK